MTNTAGKRWERIRLIPIVFKPKQNIDGETVESARSVAPRRDSEAAKIVGERTTSVLDNEEDTVKYKNYLHGLARANNVKEMQRYLNEDLVQTEKEKSESDDDEKENDLKNKLDEKDEENLSALHYAARYGNLDAVKFLVELGAEINITDNNGVTPLHSVARGRKMTANVSDKYHDVCDIRLADETARLDDGLVVKESELKIEHMIEYLISKGASQQQPDNFGQFPLHYAATRGNLPAARALICAKNTVIDVFDKQDQTPLHVASNHQYQPICELLINAGASVFVKDKRNNTPLHMAATDGNCGIIALLLNAAMKENQEKYYEYINQKNRDFDSPLMMTIGYGYADAVKLLLDRGANINIKHKKRSSTVHKASSITRDAVNILQILFDHGALVVWRNIDYETPLHTACEFNKPEVVEFLLKKGADIEARDRYGRSPFLTCLGNLPSDDNFKIVEILIKNGASIIAADKQDRTSAILAAKKDNFKALELILTSDQNFDLAFKVDRLNYTPLHVAAKAGNMESLKCLINRGTQFDAKTNDESTALHLAAKNGHVKIVEYILQYDTIAQTIRDEDDKSNLPLHLAAEAGHDEVVRILLQASSDLIEARNAAHQTPLDCASAKGNKSIVDILLSCGAKINSVDSGNCTALHQACKQGRLDMVKFLLERGAYIDSVDFNGFNCLEVAIDNNQEEVAKLLLHNKNWQYVMKHGRKMAVYPYIRTTPLRELIQKMPDVAKIVLDRCITTEIIIDESSQKQTLTKVYNYELIDDIYSNWGNQFEQIDSVTTPRTRHKNKLKDIYNGFDEKGNLRPDVQLYTDNTDEIKENHPLMIMVSQEREELLGHDLVANLLNHKWRLYGRYIYYAGLFSYVLFVAFLTDYAVNIQPPYNLDPILFDFPNDFCNNDTFTSSLSPDIIPTVKGHVRFSQYMAMIIAVIVILKEVAQAYYRRLKYVNWQNIIEIFLYVFSFLFTLDWNECSKFYGYRMPEQWPFGVAAAILAWINLVLMVRKFPQLGIYVVMFTDVLRTFSKFFVVFFLFIVAFALAFFMLFQNQAPFSSFPRTIVKTLVMMVGEFEYNAMFYSSIHDHEERAYNAQASQVVFLIFMIIMTILIMNLLVGLAVDDIKTVQGKAVLKRVAMKVELVLEIEFIVPDFIRKKWIIGQKRVIPNQVSSFFLKRWFDAVFRKSKSESVSDVIASMYADKKQEEEEKDDMLSWNAFMEKCNVLNETVNEMKIEQMEIKNLLREITAKLGIVVEPSPHADGTV